MGGFDSYGFDGNGGHATSNRGTSTNGTVHDTIMGILGGGGSWTDGRNRAFTYDGYGNRVPIGAPSLTGRGMMTTRAGYQLGNKLGGIGGLGPLNWSGGLHDRSNPFHQTYRNNLQHNIRNRGAARYRSEALDRTNLAKRKAAGAITDFDRIMGVKAAYHGDLPELEGYLGQPSAMRQTHNGGGVWGGMFNTKPDNVETTFESRDKLQADGHMNKSGNLQGWGPMNPTGFLTSLTSAPVSKALAKGVYDYTGSIPAARSIGQTANLSMGSYGKKAQPDYFSETAKSYMGNFPGSGFLSGMPSMIASAVTGAPVGIIGQTLQAADTAATLNNLGITAPGPAPEHQEDPDDNDNWWPLVKRLA